MGGTKGGQARKEQMAGEHGGDATQGEYMVVNHMVGNSLDPCCYCAAAAGSCCSKIVVARHIRYCC